MNRFLRVDEGHPLTVKVSMGRGVEVKKQGDLQFSLRFLRRRGEADLLGEGVLLAGGTSELSLTSLLANVGLNGIRTLPVAVRHHLVLRRTGHGKGITAVGTKTVKVEPVMVEAACYEHGLEPVGQGGVVQREQAVAFVRLEQGIEGRPKLRPHGVLGVFANTEGLGGMNHDTMLVDLTTQDGRDFGRTLRRHEAHSQGGMKVEGDVQVAASVICLFFALLLAILHVRAHEHGRFLDEFIGVLEQRANVIGGQAGLGVRWCTPVLDEKLPHLASLFADEGLELVNHQRRNAVQEHPLGKVTAVFSQAFDGKALLHTEVNHAGVELLGQPLGVSGRHIASNGSTMSLSQCVVKRFPIRHYVSSKREDHKQFTEMEKDTIRSLSGLKHMMSEIEDLIVKLETESRFVSVEEFNQLSDDVQEWFFDEVDWIFSIV